VIHIVYDEDSMACFEFTNTKVSTPGVLDVGDMSFRQLTDAERDDLLDGILKKRVAKYANEISMLRDEITALRATERRLRREIESTRMKWGRIVAFASQYDDDGSPVVADEMEG